MNAGARRRAFLIGCNSGGLNHCECDAERLGGVFEQLGYQVETCLASRLAQCDTPVVPAFLVRDTLFRFLNESHPGDTALIYFSGHSLFQNNVFNLVVGNDLNNCGHLLDVETLVRFFRQDPRRMNRVLILDCCEAAAAVTTAFWNATTEGVEARVWVASHKEYAWELGGPTGGSLFTQWVIEALTEAAPRLANCGCVRINKADEYVRERARAHVPRSSEQPPISGVLGFTGNDIPLEDWATDFSPSAKDDLLRLLAASGLAPAVWRPIYEDVCACAGLSAADDYRGTTEAAKLAEVIANLADAWYRPFPGVPVQVPLAEFVERIARLAPNACDLRVWLRRGLQDLARGQDLDAFIGSLRLGHTLSPAAKPRPRSNLAIALFSRDRNRATQYSIEARLVDQQGLGDPVGDLPDLAPAGSMPDILWTLLRDAAVKEAIRCRERPLTIEFFLPIGLLGTDIDAWTPPRFSTPLSGWRPVTVRAVARLGLCADPRDEDQDEDDDDLWLSDWPRQWIACTACREREQDGLDVPPCCVWVPQPRKYYQTLARDGGCIFVLGFRPDCDQLGLMLRSGLAVVLWGREPLAEDFLKTLIAEVARTRPGSPKRACLADLPLALLHLRQDAWEQDQGHTGGYHLLWDDPDRLPRFTGRPAPTAPAGPPSPILHSPY